MQHGRDTASISRMCKGGSTIGTKQRSCLVTSLMTTKGTCELHLARLGQSNSLEQAFVWLVLRHGTLRNLDQPSWTSRHAGRRPGRPLEPSAKSLRIAFPCPVSIVRRGVRGLRASGVDQKDLNHRFTCFSLTVTVPYVILRNQTGTGLHSSITPENEGLKWHIRDRFTIQHILKVEIAVGDDDRGAWKTHSRNSG